MRLRPCIDIHNGCVKQIVGASLRDGAAGSAGTASENFVAVHDACYYAEIYHAHRLSGGHIILLNQAGTPEYEASRALAIPALQAHPGLLQIGGGINPDNAAAFLEAGASHVIVTSYVFREGRLDENRLARMIRAVGREHLVLDLSCRAESVSEGETPRYRIVTDRWQKQTETIVDESTLEQLAASCAEFLVHAVDVEGRQQGIETSIAGILGSWCAARMAQGRPHPVTYAGGIHSLSDLDALYAASAGQLDCTVGSALSLFGGALSLEEILERIDAIG
ncbi:MAG: phosphoribosylformimino-5-aminoimidazole carboxamide ribotide isomerase [Butyrivibrio sp.]|nr:phosphoribosylformimino-5-aminoimidazole carboxamide ribotide isomerase [Butyrivibrio sp.]